MASSEDSAFSTCSISIDSSLVSKEDSSSVKVFALELPLQTQNVVGMRNVKKRAQVARSRLCITVVFAIFVVLCDESRGEEWKLIVFILTNEFLCDTI